MVKRGSIPKEQRLGKRRVQKLVEKYAKPFGWVNGIWRRATSRRTLPIKFLRPDGKIVPLNDFESRLKSAILALESIQKGSIDLYKQGIRTGAFIVASVVPLERARKAGTVPIRLAVVVPPGILLSEKSRVVFVPAKDEIRVPLRYYSLRDAKYLSLLEGKGHLIHNSVHESLSALYVHREFYPQAHIRGVYFTVAPADRKRLSRRLGMGHTEFDHVVMDQEGKIHVIEHKTIPYRAMRPGDWRQIILRKARAYEMPVLELKKITDDLTVHFVLTGDNKKKVKQYGNLTRQTLAAVWKELSKSIPVKVHGVLVPDLEPIYVRNI